jgi:hypothetical protein
VAGNSRRSHSGSRSADSIQVIAKNIKIADNILETAKEVPLPAGDRPETPVGRENIETDASSGASDDGVSDARYHSEADLVDENVNPLDSPIIFRLLKLT